MKALFFILILFPSSAFSATRYFLDLSANSQIRDDPHDQREIPLNGYLGFSLNDPTYKAWFDVDMRFFHEFENALDDYDLYQSAVHYRPKPDVQIDLGRQMINRGFSLDTVDGGQLTFSPFEKIALSLYAGVPRTVETGDFNEDDGLSAGIAASLKGFSRTRGGIKVAWKRDRMESVDFGANDRLLLGMDMGYHFRGAWSPFAFVLAEYDTFGSNLDTISAGIDLYPSKRVALNLGFDYFDSNREDSVVTLTDLFTDGETFSGRIGSTWTLIPSRLDFTQTYAYQNLENTDSAREPGHLFEGGFPLYFPKIGLNLIPTYYFTQSFGGRVHGARLDFREQISRWYAEGGIDYSTYVKITGNDDNAFSTFLWSGYELVKGFVFSGGVEYNANNLYEKDIRGSVKLDYRLSGEFKK
ncbi:MAG: hypothetical protein Q7T11_07995 [Deltaproteobacteria bacterium]|nr:hypothetical protein [Deltaproteobacteria bacterium]